VVFIVATLDLELPTVENDSDESRVLVIYHWDERITLKEPEDRTVSTFDVFLSYNSVDKPEVKRLGEALKKRGLTVWLDEWELQPGQPWMDALEDIIATCKSAAVCVGTSGIGPWQEPEMTALLRRFTNEKNSGNVVPVIPVLLPGAPEGLKLPLFLEAYTWVDLRAGLKKEGLDRIQWGITGVKPNPSQQVAPSAASSKPLTDFFIKSETTWEKVQQFAHSPEPNRRLLVIYGLGGVGKTSILKMLQNDFRKESLPTGYVTCDEILSATNILDEWARELGADEVELPTYSLQRQKRIEEARVRVSRRNLVGSINEAFEYFDQNDAEKKLTEHFVHDLAMAAENRRIVLILDAFERISMLDEWVRDFAFLLAPNVRLIISGRSRPRNWNQRWPEGEAEELKTMSDDQIRTLIGLYCKKKGLAPLAVQVDDIIEFSQGLPLFATASIDLIDYQGAGKFKDVKPRAIHDMVQLLLKGVPAKLRHLLEAAAVVHWFNEDILCHVADLSDVRSGFEEIVEFHSLISTRSEGFAIHDVVRLNIDKDLRFKNPQRYLELHKRAAKYFELAKHGNPEQLMLEHLYHEICIDENDGIEMFRTKAETLARERLVHQLRTLLNDVYSHPLERKNSRRWRQYYNARLAELERRFEQAEEAYQKIAENKYAEKSLRALALCDWGSMLRLSELSSWPGNDEKALLIIKRSIAAGLRNDKLTTAYANLQTVYLRSGRFEDAIESSQQLIDRFRDNGNPTDLIRALTLAKGTYARIGDLKNSIQCHERALQIAIREQPAENHIKVELAIEGWWSILWAGRYAESEAYLEECLRYASTANDKARLATLYGIYGYALGLQGRFADSAENFEKALELNSSHPGTIGLVGGIAIRKGDFDSAEEHLRQSVDIKRKKRNYHGIPELLTWLGELYEIRGDGDEAAHHFNEVLSMYSTGRNDFFCGAHVGLARLELATGKRSRDHFNPAKSLARKYEYNDRLAALHLATGHWQMENKDDRALRSYKLSLIYALRYNRFLLDEILGNVVITPMRPLIPYCTGKGEAGKQMLQRLRAWWQTGKSPAGDSRASGASGLRPGIPLLEAEHEARQREQGDGLPQSYLVEQIDQALA
jgi:tetratricopeptide (TPR) repeat protein